MTLFSDLTSILFFGYSAKYIFDVGSGVMNLLVCSRMNDYIQVTDFN